MPRRTALALVMLALVAGCVGAGSSVPGSPVAPPDTPTPPDRTPSPTSAGSNASTIAYGDLVPPAREAFRAGLARDLVEVRNATAQRQFKAHRYVRYEGTRYRVDHEGFDYGYGIRPVPANGSPSDPIAYANLSAAGKRAFRTALAEGSYEARFDRFPDALERHDAVVYRNTTYALNRLHYDAFSVLLFRFSPANASDPALRNPFARDRGK